MSQAWGESSIVGINSQDKKLLKFKVNQTQMCIQWTWFRDDWPKYQEINHFLKN